MSKGIFLGWLQNPATGKPVKLIYRGEKSLILCAPAGRGKFTKSLAHNALTYDGSLIVNDPKGEICAVTRRQRERMGHKVYVLNPFGVLAWNPLLRSDCYNPMAGLDPDGENFTSDIDAQSAALILPDGGQSHWTDSARNLVAGIMAHVVCTFPRELAHLPAVNAVLNLPQAEFLQQMRLMAGSSIDIARHAAAPYIVPDGESPPRSVWDVLNTARTQLGAFLGARGIQRVLSGSDFTWGDLKRGKVTVYIVMPEAEAKTYFRFTRLLFASAFKALLTPPRSDVLFIADELATAIGGKTLDQVETAFSLGRGYGLRMQAVFQSWAQAESLFGKENAMAILASAGIWQFMRPNDALTAKLIAERGGLREVRNVSRSINSGASSTEHGLNYSSGESISIGAQEKPLYREQDLYHMHDDAQIIVADGTGYPIEAWGVPYYTDAALRALADPNPYAPGYVPPAALPEPARALPLTPRLLRIEPVSSRR